MVSYLRRIVVKGLPIRRILVPVKAISSCLAINVKVVTQLLATAGPLLNDPASLEHCRRLLLGYWPTFLDQNFNGSEIRSANAVQPTDLPAGPGVESSNFRQRFRRLINPKNLLGFPGEKQVLKLIASGERCTWPKLEMIRLQTRISRTLREILQRYEKSVVV